MQDEVLTEILKWSTTQPGWQRDALRRLFTVGAIDFPGLDDLLDLCKGAHGLSTARTPVPLAGEHLAIGDADAAPISHKHYSPSGCQRSCTRTNGDVRTEPYGRLRAECRGQVRLHSYIEKGVPLALC